MSIKDLILFCSTTSQASIPCLKFVKQHQIPVKIVRLDTPELRERASKGKYFQILSVPNLVVLYDNGNLQQFVGRDKIIQWFTNMIRRSQQPPPRPQIEESEESADSESEEEKPVRRRRKSKKTKKPKQKKKKYEKVKQEPVEDTDSDESGTSGDEVEIYYEEDEIPPPSSTKGLMVGPSAPRPSSGSSVFDVAKEMERQRKDSLSFDKD